jgi:hypothetical protein
VNIGSKEDACELEENRTREGRSHTVSRECINTVLLSNLQTTVEIALTAFMLYNCATITI